jgi:hypothetical protein
MTQSPSDEPAGDALPVPPISIGQKYHPCKLEFVSTEPFFIDSDSGRGIPSCHPFVVTQ